MSQNRCAVLSLNYAPSMQQHTNMLNVHHDQCNNVIHEVLAVHEVIIVYLLSMVMDLYLPWEGLVKGTAQDLFQGR